MSAFLLLRQWLERRLEPKPLGWLRESLREIAQGPPPARLGALFALASRHVPRAALAPDERDLEAAGRAIPLWSPERWTLRETARVALVLAHPDLPHEAGALALEELFRYADEGELCALCRALALLPAGERFVARGREGCRSNMRSVFEAAALDTPYPLRCFDEEAFRQAAIKCLFVEAPLWRLAGLDERLSPELARMALDLADERRSAGRAVRPELWLCLGEHGGERGLRSLERELDPANPSRAGRRAAALGLARAGAGERLGALLEGEADALVRQSMEAALAGVLAGPFFRQLDGGS